MVIHRHIRLILDVCDYGCFSVVFSIFMTLKLYQYHAHLVLVVSDMQILQVGHNIRFGHRIDVCLGLYSFQPSPLPSSEKIQCFAFRF